MFIKTWAFQMAVELYLYSQIYDFVAQDLIAAMEENSGEDITIRAMCPGGDVFSGWGIVAKMKEHTGNVTIKVDGLAASMMADILLFADNVEALDVSKIMFHRANMYVSSPEDQAFLDSVNADLKAKMKAKVDSKLFKEITGYSIEDLYNPETLIDVWLTAKDAKKLGIVNKINKLNPSEVTAFNNRMKVAAMATTTSDPIKNKTMTLEEFKAAHPAVYAQIIAIGVTQGKDHEKERVKAFLKFVEIDPKGVTAAIDSGAELTPSIMADFFLKTASATALKGLEDDSAKTVTTAEADKTPTAKAKELQEFEEATRKRLDKTPIR